MAKNWKKLATAAYGRVKVSGLWTDELADRNYTGAGGAVHPDGKLYTSLPVNDVAWEQLYCDCVDAIAQAEGV